MKEFEVITKINSERKNIKNNSDKEKIYIHRIKRSEGQGQEEGSAVTKEEEDSKT